MKEITITPKEIAKCIEDLLDENENLKADLQEANDNATWWNNRYNAIVKQNDQAHKKIEKLEEENIMLRQSNQDTYETSQEIMAEMDNENKKQAKRNSRQRLANKKQQDLILKLQQENKSLKDKLHCKEILKSSLPEETEFVILTKGNYDRQQKELEIENVELKDRMKKARNLLKQHKNDLDYEPWSQYKIKGQILFDLVNTLDGVD